MIPILIPLVFGMIAFVALLLGGAASRDSMPVAGLYAIGGLGALVALWGATNADRMRTTIAAGTHMVHTLRPQGDRVIVVTIEEHPLWGQYEIFQLYGLRRQWFVNDVTNFKDGRGGI